MNATLRVPSTVSSLAHTTQGDITRIASTLSGVTTLAGLVQADQRLKRVLDNAREMRSQVRVMKRECA